MKRKILSLALAVVMALGIVTPALAYTTPDFVDLPSDNWAYGPVMRMADQGIIQGTGNGMFSPELKVSAAQFLTMVGRIVFPDTKVAESDTWYGPYITAAQSNGLLSGTQVDVNNVEAEVTRYDMAVILRAAAKKLGKTETLAQQSQVTDYLDIPNRYTEAVLAVYGMGLITGDQYGNFNGANTMQRNELATVIDRLVALKSGSSQGGIAPDPAEPTKPDPTEPTIPEDEEMATYTFAIDFAKIDHVLGGSAFDKTQYLPDVPFKVYYAADGGKTSILVAEGRIEPMDEKGSVDMALITFEAPKSWGLSARLKEGNGFYISAETVWEGQRLVTSDLRTDGRAYLNTQMVRPNGRIGWAIELTPPTGLKMNFKVVGTVLTYALKPVADATVRLSLKDGTLISEAVSGGNGKFELDCAVDILDGVLNTGEEIFQIEVYAELNGVAVSGGPHTCSVERLGANPYSISWPQGSYTIMVD